MPLAERAIARCSAACMCCLLPPPSRVGRLHSNPLEVRFGLSPPTLRPLHEGCALGPGTYGEPGLSRCRRFWNQICTERPERPMRRASCSRCSCDGICSSPKALISASSCSREMRVRGPVATQPFADRPNGDASRGVVGESSGAAAAGAVASAGGEVAIGIGAAAADGEVVGEPTVIGGGRGANRPGGAAASGAGGTAVAPKALGGLGAGEVGEVVLGRGGSPVAAAGRPAAMGTPPSPCGGVDVYADGVGNDARAGGMASRCAAAAGDDGATPGEAGAAGRNAGGMAEMPIGLGPREEIIFAGLASDAALALPMGHFTSPGAPA